MVREARAYWLTRLKVEALPCSRCGEPVDYREHWDVDHRLASIEGGDLGRDNQWPAHRGCNRRHGQRLSTVRKGTAPRHALTVQDRLFEAGSTTPASAPAHSLPARTRDREAAHQCSPLYVSEVDEDLDLDALRVGAEMLRFTPKDHQVLTARVLDSGGHSRYAVEQPRRSGKTLTIEAVLLGRCRLRPGHIVRFSAQNGIKTAARFTSMADAIGESTEWKIRRAAGSQAILFANGSRFYAHPPKADAYRGEDTDDAWLDEAQEHDLVTSRDLLSGIGPTMDTRPGSTLIVSGTVGTSPEGLLWDSLQRLRAGTAGGIEFAVPQDADVDDEETWWAAHPGLSSGLTTIEKVRERRLDMDAESFAAEYLGIWPTVSANAVIDPVHWATLRLDEALPPADGSAVVAWDSDPAGGAAAVYVAWKVHASDDVIVREMRVEDGTLWVAREVDALVRSLRAKAVYDPIGVSLDIAAQLTRLRTPRVEALHGADLKGGYASLLERINTDRLHHVASEHLDQAVVEAARRPYGESWLWKRTPSSHALVAVTHAAWVASNTKRRERTTIRTSA